MRLYFAIVRQSRHVSANNLRRCRTSTKECGTVYGGDKWARTTDLMHVKHAL